jgi:hypothetical protein
MRAVGAELFHADGGTSRQTDVTTLTVAFRNVANAPKNSTFCLQNVFVLYGPQKSKSFPDFIIN